MKLSATRYNIELIQPSILALGQDYYRATHSKEKTKTFSSPAIPEDQVVGRDCEGNEITFGDFVQMFREIPWEVRRLYAMGVLEASKAESDPEVR
jgi:hypothetical protein